MAKRNTRRARPRKRRPPSSAPAAPVAQGAGGPAAEPAPPTAGERAATAVEAERAPGAGRARESAGERRRREQARASAGRVGGLSDTLTVGERPHSPWHPFPLSELLILAGAIGAIVAWKRGVAHGGTSLLLVSIAAVMLGTVEVTLREHLSGYRSHAIMLSVLPPLAFHTAVILITQSQTTVPRWLNLVLLPIDGAIFAALFRLLRARFADARRERVFAGRR